MKKAVILLSGGLDSLVALGFPQSEYRIELALTFDYGQKSVQNEIDASQKICKYYNVEHKVIKLEWLKEITKTALVSAEEIPVTNLGTKESAAAVWIPNRNGLFLNIAASADAQSLLFINADKLKHTEVDIFAGEMIKLGRELGVPVPYNQVLYDMVKIKEAANE